MNYLSYFFYIVSFLIPGVIFVFCKKTIKELRFDRLIRRKKQSLKLNDCFQIKHIEKASCTEVYHL
jgi:uncharacterized metal-binding protein